MKPERILIIVNPTSGSGNTQKIDDIKEGLIAEGCDVDIYFTTAAGDAIRYLESYSEPLDVIAIAGGDGTVNEVVNGLSNEQSARCRLALIPMGTTNVLASELNISNKTQSIVATIIAGKSKEIFLGQINQRRFVLMAGVGFDAWVVDNISLKLKKKIGKLAYILGMLKEMFNFGKKQYSVIIDGESYLANSVVITNGRHYGGAFVLSRKADITAPTTQVLMFNGKTPGSLLRILLGLPLGIVERMNGVTSVSGKSIEITEHGVPSGREPVQADGDSLTALPLSLTMEPSPIAILVAED